MIKILIFGYGNIGSVVAKNLANNYRVDVVDPRTDFEIDHRINYIPVAPSSVSELRYFIDNKYDLVVNTLPSKLGLAVVEAAIEEETDLVDVSYMPQLPSEDLLSKAREKEILVLCDCGIAPGISNLLAGRALFLNQYINEGYIYVGGIPQDPTLPFSYTKTWNVADLEEEYRRPAGYLEDGEIKTVPALSELEEFHFFPRQRRGLETFLTDGLRSLLNNSPIRNLKEKTVRWKGHTEAVKPLLENKTFVETIEKECPANAPDLLLMECRFDNNYFWLEVEAADDMTAMQRSTALSCTEFARLVLRYKKQLKPGIYFPETLGMVSSYWDFMKEGLSRQGIEIHYNRFLY